MVGAKVSSTKESTTEKMRAVDSSTDFFTTLSSINWSVAMGVPKPSRKPRAILLMTIMILGGTVFVWLRLSSGKTVDLSRLKPEVEVLQVKTGNQDEIPEIAQTSVSTPIPVATQTPEPYNTEKKDPEPESRSFTLTAAGTVSLAGEVRKNSYSSDAKQYDYYDTMTLLKKELASDLNIVFIENLYSSDEKPTDLIAPDAAAAMLKSAGFNAAACGYSKAFDKGEAGIASTRKVLEDNGIRPVGIYENDGEEHSCSIRTQFRLPRANP